MKVVKSILNACYEGLEPVNTNKAWYLFNQKYSEKKKLPHLITYQHQRKTSLKNYSAQNKYGNSRCCCHHKTMTI